MLQENGKPWLKTDRHQPDYHQDSRHTPWSFQRNKHYNSDHVKGFRQPQQVKNAAQLSSKAPLETFKRPEQNGFRYNVDRRYSRRGVTAQECIRLEEREQYRQLLKYYNGWKKYNTHNFHNPFLPLVNRNSEREESVHSVDLNRRDMVTPQNEVFKKEKLGSKEREMYTKRIFRVNSVYKPPLRAMYEKRETTPNVQKDDKVPTEERVPSPELTKSETDEDSDQSVIITKIQPAKWRTTIIPEYNPECAYISPEWLQQWRQRFKDDQKEKSILIEEAKKKIQTLRNEYSSCVESLESHMREQLRLSKESNEVLKERFEEDLEEEGELLPELSPEAEEQVDEALHPHPPDEVLVNEFHLQIRRRDMETLGDQNWLNDEIINFYMNMLMERGKQDNMPSVYACNTFFYPKLISSGHVALKRWTRKVDIFAHEFMLVPVHLGVHWCLAVVNFQAKSLKYYDSMGKKNNECLNALCEYLKAESLDKKKQTFDMTDWVIENAKDIPQQMNCSDCGVFACKYAEYLTRNSKISFRQEHMPYFRRRMVYEILTRQLM